MTEIIKQNEIINKLGESIDAHLYFIVVDEDWKEEVFLFFLANTWSAHATFTCHNATWSST